MGYSHASSARVRREGTMTDTFRFALGSVSGSLPMNGGSPAPLSVTIDDVMFELFPDYIHLGVNGIEDARALGWFREGTHARTFAQALEKRYDRMLLARVSPVELSTMKMRHRLRLGEAPDARFHLVTGSIRALGFYAMALSRHGLTEEARRMKRLLIYCGNLRVAILGESPAWGGLWHAVCGSRRPVP